MALRCGIVGLPNVGKSTIFNALTKSSVPSENYPFCTIEQHMGIVSLPDSRLDDLNNIFRPEKVTPASVEFFDIAGLVRGAYKGEGLGNQFLGQIRQVSVIIHVVRCFENDKITHVEGSIDPIITFKFDRDIPNDYKYSFGAPIVSLNFDLYFDMDHPHS